MRTRFAPSPTGYLHLGHVYSALKCKEIVGEGEFILRFEDIDYTRVREHYYSAIIDDLEWLGMSYQMTPMRQLDRMDIYAKALQDLIALEVVYPCFCTRKELLEEVSLRAPQGEKASLYSGRCKGGSSQEIERKMTEGLPYCWRLDTVLAMQLSGELTFTDTLAGEVSVSAAVLGDVVLARKDIKTSYHIAVVVDDSEQGITDVVRGEDLLESTHIHRLLQSLLKLPEPRYHHHRLICDDTGNRLAKRHDALSVQELRRRGLSPQDVIGLIPAP